PLPEAATPVHSPLGRSAAAEAVAGRAYNVMMKLPESLTNSERVGRRSIPLVTCIRCGRGNATPTLWPRQKSSPRMCYVYLLLLHNSFTKRSFILRLNPKRDH